MEDQFHLKLSPGENGLELEGAAFGESAAAGFSETMQELSSEDDHVEVGDFVLEEDAAAGQRYVETDDQPDSGAGVGPMAHGSAEEATLVFRKLNPRKGVDAESLGRALAVSQLFVRASEAARAPSASSQQQHRTASSASTASDATTSRTASNATHRALPNPLSNLPSAHRATSSMSLQAPPTRGLRTLPSIEHDSGEDSEGFFNRSISSPVCPVTRPPVMADESHAPSRYRSPLALGLNHKPLLPLKSSSALLFPSSPAGARQPSNALIRSTSQESISSLTSAVSRASRRQSSDLRASPKRRDSSASWSGARRPTRRKRNLSELTPFMMLALQGPAAMSRVPSGDDWSHGSVMRRKHNVEEEGAGDSDRDKGQCPGSPESCASSHAPVVHPLAGPGSNGRAVWAGGHAGILGSKALMHGSEGALSGGARASREIRPGGSFSLGVGLGGEDEEWSGVSTRGSITGRFSLHKKSHDGPGSLQVLRDFLQMRSAADRGRSVFDQEESEEELRQSGLCAGPNNTSGSSPNLNQNSSQNNNTNGSSPSHAVNHGSSGLLRTGSFERTESCESARSVRIERMQSGSSLRRRNPTRKPMLESLYTRACLRPHSLQDKALRRLRGEAVGLRPLLEPASPFLLVLLAVGSLLIFWSVSAALALYHLDGVHFNAHRLRFTAYPRAPALSGVGAAPSVRVELLRSGCRVGEDARVTTAGPVAEIELENPIEIDGWRIHTEDGSLPPSNSCWRLEAWDEDVEKWKHVGQGRWRTRVDGSVLRLKRRHCHAVNSEVQLRPWWVWDLSAVGGCGIGGLLTVLAALLACLKRRESASRALQGACLVCGAIEVSCAIAYTSRGLEWVEESWICWVRTLVLWGALVLQLNVAKFQSLWILILTFILAGAVLVERTSEYDNEESILSAGEVTILALAVLAVGLRGYQKSQELAESLQAMDEEIQKFETEWSKTVLECAGAGEALEWVDELCRQYNSSVDGHVAHMRRVHTPGWDGVVGRGRWVRVASLEQLYAQAAVVAPMLFKRTAQWGAAVGGKCRVPELQGVPCERDSHGMVSWKEIWDRRKEDGWGTGMERVKAVKRAMEKLVGVYSFDAARVCDVCRQTIWIEPEDRDESGGLRRVALCLEAIAKDSSVEVVAVKNAMHQSGPSLHTAGFRFVKVLLRIVCARARGLGVDGHVCEVILALQRMAPSQNEEVQKRYLRFRKARSERDRLMACLAWHRRVVQACAGGRHWWERESAQQQQHDQSPGGTMHGFFDVEGGGGSHEPWQLEEDEELDEEEVEAQQRLWAGVAGDVREQCRSAMWKVVVGRQLGGEPGKVERRAENMYEAVAKASTSSVLSMPRPIAAMLCKPIFVCLATLAAAWMLYMASAMMARPRIHTASQLRFTNLRRRDGQEPITHPGVGDLIALLDGCEVSARVESWVVNGTQLTISYAEEIRWNVLRIQTLGHGSPQADAASFTLEERSRKGSELGEWKSSCSSSSFRGGVIDGEGWLRRCGVIDLPHKRNEWVELEVLEGWYLSATEEASFTVVAIGLLGGVFLALNHKQILAKRVMAGAMWLSVLLLLLCMSLSFADKDTWKGVYSLCTAGAVAVVAACIQWRERRLIDAILLSGIINWIKVMVLAARAGATTAGELVDVTASLQILLAVVMKLYGMVGYWKAARLAAQDTKVYQQIWEEVMEKEGARQTLELIDSWRSDLQQEAVEQRGVPWTERHDYDEALGVGWWTDASLSHTRELHRLCPPLHSIDQIIAQGEVSSILLKAKIQDWAMASNGKFLLEKEVPGRGRFVRWGEAVQDRGMQGGIKWGVVKGRERAMEKMHRCYKGRCARLCDVSRQSIVFDCLEDMLACLEAMAIDQEILLVRVKNTLHPQAEKLSWGYRQVCINLLHVMDLTERLGISLHVSEVQLILEPFAALKSDEGHRRYVEARNARGE